MILKDTVFRAYDIRGEAFVDFDDDGMFVLAQGFGQYLSQKFGTDIPLRVLVTGGAGYIGSHACKALRAAGFNPVTFDSLVTGWEDAVKFGPFERGDLLDRARLDEVFAAYRPVAVMHFAALRQVVESLLSQTTGIGSMAGRAQR